MTQGIFRIIFPKSMILNKIRNFVNPGNDSGEFPENFSRHILLQLFSNFSDFIYNQDAWDYQNTWNTQDIWDTHDTLDTRTTGTPGTP